MSEHRLDNVQALAVDMVAEFAADHLFHLLQRTGLLSGDMLRQRVDLTGPFCLALHRHWERSKQVLQSS